MILRMDLDAACGMMKSGKMIGHLWKIPGAVTSGSL